MSDFYLNVKQYGDNILYTGIKNGKRIRTKVPYSPNLFVPCNEESQYKTLYGENLKKIKPGSIKKCKEFVNQYSTVDNFKVYGNTQYEYCLISDLFVDDIEWDISKIRIAIFDIEVGSDPQNGGFASPQNPFQPIISISLKFIGEEKYYLFGYDDFNCPDNVTYIKCKDEWTLLKNFIDVWSFIHPDIVSGWNSSGFDIPYLINRCNKILGEKETKKLSCWGILQDKKTRKFNPRFNQYEEEISYSIVGTASLDYLDLYKKYQPGGNSQESYKLDFIASEEVGENKVEYDGSLHKLYTEDKQKFYEYNIQDVRLIELLNDKCKLFELCLTLAYDSKTNFEDVFKQTRMWDALIYDFLKKKNIQIPQKEEKPDSEYAGAYVKYPIVGMHRWVSTLDATSLYPSIIMAKNISIETLVQPEDYNQDMKHIISQGITVEKLLQKQVDLSKLVENKITLTPNGQFFRTDKKGFLPEMVEKMFKARQEYKKKMLSAQKEYEQILGEFKTSNSTDLKERLNQLQYDISKFNNLQNSKKLCLNSLYGATGNKHFRFFDVRMAEAITLEGQLSNRWVENSMNQYLNGVLKTDTDYVIYMDTDSLAISLEKIVEKTCPKDYSDEQKLGFIIKLVTQKIQPEVDKFCETLSTYVNSYTNALSYKLEKICSNSVFVAKKRYALNVFSNEGVIYSEPKIKVTGLEIVKSSTPAIVREALKDCVKLILNDTEENLQKYIEEFKRKFNSLRVEEISFPRGINGLYKYSDQTTIYKKGTPIHVRGSILFNKLIVEEKLDNDYELIKESDKIKFCYLKVPNVIKENVISFPEKLPKEFKLHDYVDYDLMFNKVFLEPLNSITEKIDWSTEKKNSIEDFFV